jgi:hypothetical protein
VGVLAGPAVTDAGSFLTVDLFRNGPWSAVNTRKCVPLSRMPRSWPAKLGWYANACAVRQHGARAALSSMAAWYYES